MAALPEIDLASPLQFVINAAAGSTDAQAKREVIEAALRAGGRRGDLLFCGPAELTGVSQQAATRAIATRTAVSSRVSDGVPNSVNVLRCGADAAPGCCRIEQWDYRADDRVFRLAKVSEVRPDRA